MSDLLLAICGEELDATSSKPFQEPLVNSNYSDYSFMNTLKPQPSNQGESKDQSSIFMEKKHDIGCNPLKILENAAS